MATDRFALVTGGGVRLGRAISEGLAEHGFHVAVHFNGSARRRSKPYRRSRLAVVAHSLFSAISATQPRAARSSIEVLRQFAALDLLVNSAASFTPTRIGETTSAVWDEAFALNIRAPFLISQAAAARIRDGGSIVNIADLAGVQAWPSYLAHGASKAALIHLTRSLARALGPRVRVNAIAPGAVLLPKGFAPAATERVIAETPLGRLGDPNDIVQAVRYLIDAEFVTGTLHVVDGGRSAH